MKFGTTLRHFLSGGCACLSALGQGVSTAPTRDVGAGPRDLVHELDTHDRGQTDWLGRPIGTRENPINYPDSGDGPFLADLVAPADEVCGAGVGQTPDLGGIASVPPNSAVREWVRAGFGTGIGVKGMYVVDIDGDGLPEIVASASVAGTSPNTFWYTVSHTGQDYQITYISGPYAGGVQALRVVDTDGDGDAEVLVASPDTIFLYDGASKSLIRSFPIVSTGPRGVRVADVDGDGQLEVVFCDTTATAVYDLTTGQLEWRSTDFPGVDLDVGNVDRDPDIEIVISSGVVLNGRDHSVEWNLAGGFGSLVRVGDIDGDGMAEIVGLVSTQVRVTDGDIHATRSPRPSFSAAPTSLQLLDVDGDGVLEIATGNSQWGNVYVLDGATVSVRWSFPNPDSGVDGLAAGDADHDGQIEFLWSAGYASTGADHLRILDAATRLLEWTSGDVDGPYYGMACVNLNSVGGPELLLTCDKSRSGYEDGIYFIHDGATHDELFEQVPLNGVGLNGVWRIAAGNFDHDRQLEYVVTASRGYNGILVCLDGISHEEMWRTAEVSSLAYRALQIADVDDDEVPDVCAAVARATTGASGAYVYVYDGATGLLKWRSPSIGIYWAQLNFLRIANIDDDTNAEIVVADAGGAVYAFDGITHDLQFTSADLGVTALELVDLDGDYVREIVVGTETGDIMVLDRATGAVSRTLFNVGAQVNGLQVGDFFGGPALEVAYCAGGRLVIRKAVENAPVIWSSEELGPSAGANDSLLAADIDGDSRIELVVNTTTSVQVFELRRSLAGDMNCDGRINGFDIDPFVLAVVRPDLYALQFPSCDILRGDVDGNGRFDNFDIDPFVGLLVD